MERWVQGCAVHIGRLFRPLRFTNLPMTPLLFKIGLHIGRVFVKYFCKKLFDEFIFWLNYRLSKSTMVKSIGLFKKGPLGNKWLRPKTLVKT